MAWSTQTVALADIRSLEPEDEEASADVAVLATAVRNGVRDRLRRGLTPIADRMGVTETALLDEITGDLATTTDVRLALARLFALEHLYRFYRSKADRPGRGLHDASRRDLYDRDAGVLAASFAALVERALVQGELVFESADITRSADEDVVWLS